MEQAIHLANFWSPVSLHRKRRQSAALNVQSCREVLGDRGWSWSRPWSRPFTWPTSGLLSLYIEREENQQFSMCNRVEGS